MTDGTWIPISKSFTQYLPKDRPYTKLEAVFSLQKIYAEENTVTTLGLAKLWGWSRQKVMDFIKELQITIGYCEHQRNGGKLEIEKKTQERHNENIKKTQKNQLKFIDSKDLPIKKDIKKTLKKHKENTSPDTIIKTIKTLYKEKVFLFEDEYKKLVEQFGEKGTLDRIDNLNNYLCSKGKKYASHYHTILSWERKNNPQPTVKPKPDYID